MKHILAFILLLSAVGFGATITVIPGGGGNFTTINAALADAGTADGDVIVVSEGTYDGIHVTTATAGKAITIQPATGETVTLDKSSYDPVDVDKAGDFGDTSKVLTIEGLTVDGTGQTWLFQCDGGKSITLKNLTITNNQSTYALFAGGDGTSTGLEDRVITIEDMTITQASGKQFAVRFDNGSLVVDNSTLDCSGTAGAYPVINVRDYGSTDAMKYIRIINGSTLTSAPGDDCIRYHTADGTLDYIEIDNSTLNYGQEGIDLDISMPKLIWRDSTFAGPTTSVPANSGALYTDTEGLTNLEVTGCTFTGGDSTIYAKVQSLERPYIVNNTFSNSYTYTSGTLGSANFIITLGETYASNYTEGGVISGNTITSTGRGLELFSNVIGVQVVDNVIDAQFQAILTYAGFGSYINNDLEAASTFYCYDGVGNSIVNNYVNIQSDVFTDPANHGNCFEIAKQSTSTDEPRATYIAYNLMNATDTSIGARAIKFWEHAVAIGGIDDDGSTVTVDTSIAHNLEAGALIEITGTTNYNATEVTVLTITDADTFTYAGSSDYAAEATGKVATCKHYSNVIDYNYYTLGGEGNTVFLFETLGGVAAGTSGTTIAQLQAAWADASNYFWETSYYDVSRNDQNSIIGNPGTLKSIVKTINGEKVVFGLDNTKTGGKTGARYKR